jgi:translation initiation factor IF-3
VGRRIRVPEIRVIGPLGQQMGVMTVEQALLIADADGLDLVEVSPKAFPPVCRIMDYGKFKYELAKKDRSARRHRSTVQIKEVKFRPKTDAHDMDFKLRHIRRFLGEGNKARLVVTFRGREMAHPDLGHALLQRLAQEVHDLAAIEQAPMMEGKRLMLVLAPRVGVVRPAVAPAATTSGASMPAAAVSAAPSVNRK